MEIENLASLEALAKEKLHPHAFDYYASGADDELALRGARAAFERIALHYRVLVDVSRRSARTTVLGHEVSMPVLVAPTAFHKMAHPEGELATRRAAARAGTIMTLSSLSNTDVEDVAKAAEAPLFFQLYVYKDRGVTEALVRRVEAAGCKALVVTVDAPLLGRRERDVRNRFALPEGLYVKNLVPAGHGDLARAEGDSGLAAYVSALLDPSLSYRDIEWLARATKLPVVVKGLVRADDARKARDAGARAVVVSNHGGRQLDAAPPTIDVVGAVADALAGSIEVWLDGGVRRGTDVLKALAYGARAVLLGRPILWGLALGGEDGAHAVLSAMAREVDLAMALTGCPDVASITRDLVTPGGR